MCEADVSLAIKYAVSNNLEVAVVAGGHSFMAASSSEGGAHIDLRRMRRTVVENEAFGTDGTMTIEGGVTAGEVAEACTGRGTCTVLPAVKELGYMGFALGGGAGWTMGLMGLAIDQFIEARIVLASGDIVTASEESHPDLFWAIKGAGYNFGVVTSVKIKVWGFPSKMVSGSILYPPSSFAAVFEAAERYLKTQQPEDCMSLVYLTCDPQGNPGEFLLGLPCYYGADEAEARRRFRVFLDVPSIFVKFNQDWFPRTGDTTPEAVWPYTRRTSNGTLFTRMAPEIWLPVLDRVKQWAEGEMSRRKGTTVFLGLFDWRKVLTMGDSSAWPVRAPPDDGDRSYRDCALYIT